MTRAESPEPVSGGSVGAGFSFDKFFHDAHERGIAAAVEERPAEAAVMAVGAVAAGAAAVYLTKGGALAGIFRNTLADEMAASPKLLASLSRAGVKQLPLGQLEPEAERLVTSGLPLTMETRVAAAIRTSGLPFNADTRAASFLPSALKARLSIGQSVDLGLPTYAGGVPRAAASGVKPFEQATYEYVPHSTAPVGEFSVFEKGATGGDAFDAAPAVKSFDPFSAFDQSGYRFVPVRQVVTQIRLAQGTTMRAVDGPSQIVFGEDNSVEHILFNSQASPTEKADLVMRAGYADLIRTDSMAAKAASRIEGQTIGFHSQPIERIASPEQMQQIASDGARAYVEMDAPGANKFTAYLTDLYGPMTKESQAWGRHILTDSSSPESPWNWKIGPAKGALLQNGMTVGT